MSNELVNWEDKVKADAKAVAQMSAPAVGRLSFMGGLMYNGNNIPAGKVEVVVLNVVRKHAYYPNPYDSENPVPPDCFALSATGGAMVPHPDVEDPQATTCEDCPLSKFKSHPNGRGGKACKEYYELAVMPSGNALDPESIKGSEIALAPMSVTTNKAWEKYANLVTQGHGTALYTVITEIERRPHPKNQYELVFNLKGKINDGNLIGPIIARSAAAQEVLMTPFAKPEEKGAETAVPSGKKKKY